MVVMTSCNAPMFVIITRSNQTATMMEDMILVKKDALNARYSLNGMVCDVLFVDVCCGQDFEVRD